jgi:hypothetical protein
MTSETGQRHEPFAHQLLLDPRLPDGFNAPEDLVGRHQAIAVDKSIQRGAADLRLAGNLCRADTGRAEETPNITFLTRRKSHDQQSPIGDAPSCIDLAAPTVKHDLTFAASMPEAQPE